MVIQGRLRPQSTEVCHVGNLEEETWEESCLRNFSQCMDLSIEGFEGDFLELMNRVSRRRNKGKGRGASGSTQNVEKTGVDNEGWREFKIRRSR